MQPGATPSRLLPGLGLMTFAVYETERSRKVAPSPKLLEIVFGAHLRCPTARHASFVGLPGNRRCCSRACFGQMQPVQEPCYHQTLARSLGLMPNIACDFCGGRHGTFQKSWHRSESEAARDHVWGSLALADCSARRMPASHRAVQPSNARAHSSEPTCSLQSCATSSPLGTLSSCGRR